MLADLMGPASWSGWQGPITNLMLRDTTQGNIFQYFSYIMNRISNKNIIYIYFLYCTRAGFYAKKHHWLNVTIPCHHCTCLKWCVNWLQPSCKWHIWGILMKPCHPGSPCWPVGSSVVLAPPRWMNIGSTSKKTPPWNGASNRWRWRTELADHGFRWIDVDWYGLILD